MVRDEPALPVVALACSAPSIANSQPWRWRIGREGAAPTLDLALDPDRWLGDLDAAGRQLVISCGAALHHAAWAARGLGWDPQVRPSPGRRSRRSPDHHLARLVLRPAAGVPPPDTLDVLVQRCTDRRRFTAWPVPGEELRALAYTARRHGVEATAVVDVSLRFRAGLLADRALAPGELSPADGLLVLGSTADVWPAWLRTGVALGALWLEATRAGLTVVPLSAPVEDAAVQAALRTEVLADRWHPHLVVRVGWQALGRHHLARTPRRPLTAVLDD